MTLRCQVSSTRHVTENLFPEFIFCYTPVSDIMKYLYLVSQISVHTETVFFFLYKFIYLFMAVLGLHCCMRAFSSCGEWGYSSLRCAGFSLRWLLLLRSTGSRHAGFSSCARGLSCCAACGIFLDQGSNPSPLHWQADF